MAKAKEAEKNQVKSVLNPKTEDEGTTPQTPEEFLANHENPTVQQMWGIVAAEVSPLSAMQEKVRKSSPPPVSELDEKLKTSEDPQVIEYREAIEKLEAALREAREDAHKYLLKDYQTLSSEEIKDLKADYSKQYEKAKAAWTMLHNYAKFMSGTDVDVTGVVENLEKFRLPSLRGIGGNTGNANTEGTPRTQITSVVVTRENGTEKTFDKLSSASVWAKVPTADIIREWLAKAEVSTWQEVDKEVTFEVEKVTFVITPRDTEE